MGASKTILLTTPEGRWIKYVSRHEPKRAQVNCLIGVVQEEVPVVRDFPEVFPEELPGMPPDRDIEFFDSAIARHRSNIKETIQDACKGFGGN